MSAEARVKSFIDRVLRLKEEQDSLAADIREVYAEAKSEGYDKTAMGAVVAHLRKVEKRGADTVAEGQTMFDLYLAAYEGASHTHAYAREGQRNEPAAAVETAGDYLREPAATVSGQIVREGDAPRETDRCSGDASFPDAHSHPAPDSSPDVGQPETPISSPVVSGAVSQPFQPPAFLRKTAADYRPHCQSPDACAASGLQHCYQCAKLIDAARDEVAA